jgi:hypothetical protein
MFFNSFLIPITKAYHILVILEFENRHNLIIELIELYFFPNKQYMGSYVFIHIIFFYKKE